MRVLPPASYFVLPLVICEAVTLHAPVAGSDRNAVFSTTCFYDERHFPRKFFKTLRDTGFAGDIVVGADPDLPDGVARFLREVGATVHTAICKEQHDALEHNELLRRSGADLNLTSLAAAVNCDADWEIGQLRSAEAGVVDPGRFGGSVCQTRYRHYQRWLEEGGYDAVWLLDARDVIFQADPFARTPHGVYLYMDWNTRKGSVPDRETEQIKRCMGKASLDAVISAGTPNVCAGTIFGSGPEMQKFLGAMNELVKSSRSTGACREEDQHVLIYLASVRKEELQLKVHGSWQGSAANVATHWLCDEAGERLNEKGALVNSDGEVIPVIHKYDKCHVTQQLAQPQVQRGG
jgi:hypothetical protein